MLRNITYPKQNDKTLKAKKIDRHNIIDNFPERK